MKKVYILLFFILCSKSSFSQLVTVGDSTNRFVERLNFQLTNGSASFDLDCDGAADVSFDSWPGCCYPQNPTYPTLQISTSKFEYMCAYAYINTFNAQQSFDPNNLPVINGYSSYWNSGHRTIYYRGPQGGGTYSTVTIQKKYIVFRKKTSIDTTYYFMQISNGGENLIVHNVISDCPSSRILGREKDLTAESVKIYPNPFIDKLRIENNENRALELTIYNLQGKLIRNFKNNKTEEMDLSELSKGIYILKAFGEKEVRTERLIKN